MNKLVKKDLSETKNLQKLFQIFHPQFLSTHVEISPSIYISQSNNTTPISTEKIFDRALFILQKKKHNGT